VSSKQVLLYLFVVLTTPEFLQAKNLCATYFTNQKKTLSTEATNLQLIINSYQSTPKLSPKELRDFFLVYQDLKTKVLQEAGEDKLSKINFTNLPSPLIKQFIELENMIWQGTLRLTIKPSLKYWKSNYEIEEVFSLARDILRKAVRGYKPNFKSSYIKGYVQFSTYAVSSVLKTLSRELPLSTLTKSTGRVFMDKVARLKKIERAYYNEFHSKPSFIQLSNYATEVNPLSYKDAHWFTVEHVEEIKLSQQQNVDNQVKNDDGKSSDIFENIESTAYKPPDETLDAQIMRETVIKSLKVLAYDWQREAYLLHYGFIDGKEYSTREITEKLGNVRTRQSIDMMFGDTKQLLAEKLKDLLELL
jgi:hypothetical protein